jgi:cardiolipin synthase
VGSYNLDARSLLYNWEVALEILDPEVAGKLEAKFKADLEKSEAVEPARWRRRGPWQKLRERIFYFFRLWL